MKILFLLALVVMIIELLIIIAATRKIGELEKEIKTNDSNWEDSYSFLKYINSKELKEEADLISEENIVLYNENKELKSEIGEYRYILRQIKELVSTPQYRSINSFADKIKSILSTAKLI